MMGRRRFACSRPRYWAPILVVLLLFGCQEDRPQRPSPVGQLNLELLWDIGSKRMAVDPVTAAGDAVVPSLERLDLQVHRSLDSLETLLAETSAEIESGQTGFQIAVAVPEGVQTSVEVAAYGTIVGEPMVTEPGFIFYGRAEDLTIRSGQETEAQITLHPFYPRDLTAQGTIGDGYQLSWRPAPGSERYVVRREFSGGETADTTVFDTTFVADPDASGTITQRLIHRIRAENRYFIGAFSDTIGVPANPPTIPAPTDLSAEAFASDSIRIGWDYPFRLPDAYHLERRTPPEETWNATPVLPGDQMSFVDTEVERATTYFYRIRAQQGEIYSAYAGPDSATTLLDPPDAPTAVETDPISVRIDWDYPPPLPDAFGIWKRDLTAGGDWQRIDTVSGEVRTYEDPDVGSGNSYAYAIDVVDNGITSDRSDTVQITLAALVVNPPANLFAIAAGPAEIDLTWTDDVENETHFIIERMQVGDTVFLAADTVLANTEAYIDRGLLSRSVYTYQVRSWSAVHEVVSEPSNSAIDRTWPPTVPLIDIRTVSADSLKVDWLYSETSPELFFLERRISGEAGWTELDAIDGAIRHHADTGLTSRTTYVYRIRAFEEGDYSLYSDADSAATTPEAPSQLAAAETESTTVRLTWHYATPDPTTFEIWRQELGAKRALDPLASVEGSSRTFTDDAVAFSITYEYAVIAEDVVFGQSKLSSTARITITGGGPPAAPSDLEASATGLDSIVLTWTDNATDETEFGVERKAEDDTTFSTLITLPADTESLLDQGLMERTTYTYRLFARNDSGASSFSNEASARTWPPRPTDLLSQGANIDDIELSWSYTPPDPELFYIEVRPNGEEIWTSYAPLPGTSRSSLLTDLIPRTLYDIRMRAEEEGNSSPYSEVILGKTPPPPPSSFTASYTDFPPTVSLAWAYAEPEDPDHFELSRAVQDGSDWVIIDPDIPGTIHGGTDLSVEYDTSYDYRLRAIDLYDNATQSVGSDYAIASVNTPMWPPGVPTALAVTRDPDGDLALTWAASSGQVDQYEIHRRRMQDTTFALIATVAGTTTQFTDSSVLPARTYAYKVRALNDAGSSSYSAIADETTRGWRRIQVQGTAPESRNGHCGSWMSDDALVLIYGGRDADQPFTDLWEYDPSDSSWTEIAYDGSVPSRYGASAAYDPVNRTLFVEGGTSDPLDYAGYQFDRTAGLWSAVCLGEGVQFLGKTGTATTWASGSGSFYSYGGYSTDGVNEDWYISMRGYAIPSSCDWFSIINQPPSARSGHVLHAYASSTLLLFGGRDSVSLFNGLHTGWINGSEIVWSPMDDGDNGLVPDGRYDMDSAFDSNAMRLYILGGYTGIGGGRRNDLYMFQLASPSYWSLIDNGGTEGVTHPNATEALLVVDPSTGHLYHFGPGSSSLDVWLYIP